MAAASDADSASAGATNSKQSKSVTTAGSPSAGRGSSGTTDEADDCSYALIGGTAIAVAVAAVGVVQYRDKIHEAVSQVVPAISKGIADAKYALFDA